MIDYSNIRKGDANVKRDIKNKLTFLNVWHHFKVYYNLATLAPGVYFFHSAALPGMYLSPCVYLSPALIRINTVYALPCCNCLCGVCLCPINMGTFTLFIVYHAW